MTTTSPPGMALSVDELDGMNARRAAISVLPHGATREGIDSRGRPALSRLPLDHPDTSRRRMTPTASSLEWLRYNGWYAEVVERWIPGADVRKDHLGFI
jgi:hypothetical protein